MSNWEVWCANAAIEFEIALVALGLAFTGLLVRYVVWHVRRGRHARRTRDTE